MAWQIRGEYFETCSCDFLCPCPTSNLTARPTQGWSAQTAATRSTSRTWGTPWPRSSRWRTGRAVTYTPSASIGTTPAAATTATSRPSSGAASRESYAVGGVVLVLVDVTTWYLEM